MVGLWSYMESKTQDNSNCELSAPSNSESRDEGEGSVGETADGIRATETSEEHVDESHEENHDKELRSILKQKGQYTMRKVKVDFDLIPKEIPYDETKDYTIDIQIVYKEPLKVKSWAALFALKKAEAEAEALAAAEAEAALKKAADVMKREAMKRAQGKSSKVSSKTKAISQPKLVKNAENPPTTEVLHNDDRCLETAESSLQDTAESNTIQAPSDSNVTEDVLIAASSLVDDILSLTPVILGAPPEDNELQPDTDSNPNTTDDEYTLQSSDETHQINREKPAQNTNETPAADSIQEDSQLDRGLPTNDRLVELHPEILNQEFNVGLVKVAPLEIVSVAVELLGEIELVTSSLVQNVDKAVP